MKKVMFWVLVVVMVVLSVSLVGCNVDSYGDDSKGASNLIWASKPTSIDNFNYKLNVYDAEVVIEKYKGADKMVWIDSNYVIDEKVYTVQFNDEAVFALKKVSSVIIPDGVTTITNNYFNSSGIEYLYLPGTLQSVGERGTNFFSYIRHNIKEIYFGGTHEQWQSLTHNANPEHLQYIAVYCNAILPENFNGETINGELYNLSYGNKDENGNVDVNESGNSILEALQYNIKAANGEFIRPDNLLDGVEDVGGYWGLVGTLAASRINASLLDEHTQVYRTLYYALHWETAYIDEFGKDDYMERAKEEINSLITAEEIEKIDEYFSRLELMQIEAIKEYKLNAMTVNYEDVIRNPDNYKGKIIKVTVTVSQVMGGGGGLLDFIYENGYHGKSNGNEWYISYTLPEGASRIIEGDTVTFYGEFNGLKRVTRVTGQSELIPEIKAEYYD